MSQWTDRLVRAGWSRGRQVDLSAELAAYRASGYDVWPELVSFLAEHAGLAFHSTQPGNLNAFRVDPDLAANNSDREETAECESLAHTRLVPVGRYHAMTILLGRDGQFYGVTGNRFGPIGSTLEEAVTSTIDPGEPRPLDLRLTE